MPRAGSGGRRRRSSPGGRRGSSVWVPARRGNRRAVGVDPQEERRSGPVRDPRPGDVAHALAGGARAGHHDADTGGAKERTQPQRHVEREVRLADPGDDAARAAPVLDLPGGGPRPDRLRREVCLRVVSRIDHDDRTRGRARGACQRASLRPQRPPTPSPRRHPGAHPDVRDERAGTKSAAAAIMSAFASVESRSTARAPIMQSPARRHSAAPKAPIRTRSRLDELSRRRPRRAR